MTRLAPKSNPKILDLTQLDSQWLGSMGGPWLRPFPTRPIPKYGYGSDWWYNVEICHLKNSYLVGILKWNIYIFNIFAVLQDVKISSWFEFATLMIWWKTMKMTMWLFSRYIYVYHLTSTFVKTKTNVRSWEKTDRRTRMTYYLKKVD